ncbi:CLUMA_CG019334, isoform A [Clunio marinus]|uniref:CLUMA_CG019334, isoform A n=1 Tax=Clunio marinus TaxID=568069 RepID=A0A1J1J3V4_9DIPT|nr:CLUMA_CG019334, isoform A [Clunio marinus]
MESDHRYESNSYNQQIGFSDKHNSHCKKCGKFLNIASIAVLELHVKRAFAFMIKTAGFSEIIFFEHHNKIILYRTWDDEQQSISNFAMFFFSLYHVRKEGNFLEF